VWDGFLGEGKQTINVVTGRRKKPRSRRKEGGPAETPVKSAKKGPVGAFLKIRRYRFKRQEEVGEGTPLAFSIKDGSEQALNTRAIPYSGRER